MVAREFYSRRELRLWRDGLLKLRAAPFSVGDRSLMVAYAVAAEASCFLVLGWPLPANVVDLYAEHLVDINGLGLPGEAYTLLGAMARYRLPVMSATHKTAMRSKILDQDHWSPDEMAEFSATVPTTWTPVSACSRRWSQETWSIGNARPGAAPTWLRRLIFRTTASR